MKVTVNVRGDAEVRQALRDLGKNATPALVASINRVVRDTRSRVVRKTTEIYNISARDLRPYVSAKSASKNDPNALIRMHVRAIPIEFFKPRVKMQTFTFQVRGKTVTRKLPAIYLRRYRGGAEKYVAPAFPLTQRRTGLVARGEKVRRRIGADRDRLTRIRYYTFPKQFVDEVLLPDAQQFIPERMRVELRSAIRRYSAKSGLRTLRGNRQGGLFG